MAANKKKKKRTGKRRPVSGSGKQHQSTHADIHSALTAAAAAFQAGNKGEIPSLLEPYEAEYPFDQTATAGLYDRLLSFGYIHRRQYLEAERVAARGLTTNPDSADLLYVCTFLKATLRQFTEAIDSGHRYLSQLDVLSSSERAQLFAASDAHKSQLLNFVATSYRQSEQIEPAAECFRASIAADPGNHLPYLNYASMLAHEGKLAQAQKTVDQGIARCSQVHELRMVIDGFTKKATISACMIVKDEEEMLEDCLKSIRDWVDEIILVDTGSTDRTVEIAESYGAKIFFQQWEGNFSKARNYSLEQATCDWVFIIDADERVYEEDVPNIIRFVNDEANRFISVNVINVYGDHEDVTTFLPSERFFRRDLNLRYKGIVHNQLDVPAGVAALRTPIRIKHYGYGLSPEKMHQKLARSRALLEKQLADEPDNAFAHFNLAQLLRAGDNGFPVENAPLIIEHASRGVDLTDPDNNRQRHIHLMCLDQLAWTYFHTGAYEQAEQFASRAIAIKSDYLDPLLLLGHIAARQQQYSLALNRYRTYLDHQAAYDPTAELSNIILFHVDSRAQAYYAMALCALGLDQRTEARNHLRMTTRLVREHLDANVKLGKMLLEDGEFDEAADCFRQQLQYGRDKYEAALGLAAIHLQREQFDDAEEHYMLALNERPGDPVALTRLGRLYGRTGRGADAARILESLDIQNGDTTVLKDLAQIYFESGDFTRASDLYRRLVASGQADAEVLNDLGNCYFKQKDFKTAEQFYERALDCADPMDSTWRNLALARIHLNRPADAVEPLSRYLEEHPDDRELALLSADLLLKTGDFQSAISLYERLLTDDSENIPALFGLSECYFNLGHVDSAVLGYRRILQIMPDYEPAVRRLGALPRTSVPG